MNDRLRPQTDDYAIPILPVQGRAGERGIDVRLPTRAWPDRHERLALHPLAIRECEAIQTRLWLGYPDGSAGTVTTFIGANPGCGVSTVAANFAAALAHGTRDDVLLVRFGERAKARIPQKDALDLERWLDDQARPPRASAHTPHNILLLTSDSLGRAVSALLRSAAFDDFLARARARFGHVVIDAPPLQGNAEGLVLCRKADGAVLVVGSGRTRTRAALWAREEIVQARANLVGVVLNRHRHYIPRWLYRML